MRPRGSIRRRRAARIVLALVVASTAVSATLARKRDRQKEPPVPRWTAVAVVDRVAYFGRSDGVIVIDFSDRERPVELGRLPLFEVHGLQVVGTTAWIAAGSHGLYRVDFSDPAAPEVLAWFDTPGSVRDVAVRGDIAYVADDREGLRVVDYAYEGQPRQVASEPTRGEARSLRLLGDRLALAEGQAGVRLFDVSRPRHPRRTFELREAATALDVAMDDRRLVVAAGRRGILVYRIDDGPPRLLASLDTDRPARRVELWNELALVAYGAGGIDVFDLSDPQRPARRSGVVLPGGHPVWRFAGSSGLTWTAGLESGFGLVDLTNPDAPAVLYPRKRRMTISFP